MEVDDDSDDCSFSNQVMFSFQPFVFQGCRLVRSAEKHVDLFGRAGVGLFLVCHPKKVDVFFQSKSLKQTAASLTGESCWDPKNTSPEPSPP